MTQLTLETGFVRAQSFLEGHRDRSVVLCASDDGWSAGYLNGWMGYFARNNQVWALNPRVNDQNLRVLSAGGYLDGFPGRITPDMLILTTRVGSLWAGAGASTVWQAGEFRASEPTPKPFALVCHLGIRASSTHMDRGDLIVPPDEPEIHVVSSYAGAASLVMRAANPETQALMPSVAVVVDDKPAVALPVPGGEWRFEFALHQGLNRLRVARYAASAPPAALPSVLMATGVRLSLDADRDRDRVASGSP
jgi:hypothetical protein